LSADPARTGVLLDFDGTLTPIVDDPTRRALPARTAEALERLAARLAVVAVVSGRPAAFLAERVPVAGVRRLGLYGLEEAGSDGRVRARPEAAAWQEAVTRGRERLREAAATVEGAWVEDKGLSVAVHWRPAPDRAAAESALRPVVDALVERTGLVREPGKLVEELRPPTGRDKGTVVEELADGADLAELAYAGDDTGDLPALRAVRRRGGLVIVVDHGDETPPELRGIADVCVVGVGGVGELLAALARRLA
jgi:trehalose 6-phosphate phosphatase